MLLFVIIVYFIYILLEGDIGLLRVTISDKIKVIGKGNGIIRYIGFPLLKPCVWYGIELEDSNKNNNGTIDNISYFKCQDKHGFFVQVTSLQGVVCVVSL